MPRGPKINRATTCNIYTRPRDMTKPPNRLVLVRLKSVRSITSAKPATNSIAIMVAIRKGTWHWANKTQKTKAPAIISSPWAKFNIRSTPKISVKPEAIKA